MFCPFWQGNKGVAGSVPGKDGMINLLCNGILKVDGKLFVVIKKMESDIYKEWLIDFYPAIYVQDTDVHVKNVTFSFSRENWISFLFKTKNM